MTGQSRRWDAISYGDIVSVAYDSGALTVGFANGDVARVAGDVVLPPGSERPRWAELTWDEQEIIVPCAGEPAAIPWITIRLHTDAEFSAYWAEQARRQQRKLGQRLRWLRERQAVGQRDLAERVGIGVDDRRAVEAGEQPIDLTLTQQLLAALGCTMDDIALPPDALQSVEAR